MRAWRARPGPFRPTEPIRWLRLRIISGRKTEQAGEKRNIQCEWLLTRRYGFVMFRCWFAGCWSSSYSRRYSMSSDLPESTAVPAFQPSAVNVAVDHGRKRLEAEVVALFEEFRDPLLRYLLSLGLAPQDGEEVVQEVFLSLFQHLRDGKSRENLRGWLFKVASNLAFKRHNRTRRISVVQAEEGAEELMIDPGPSPEDQVLQNQTQRRLLAVVQALPEQDRRCLHLRAEGLRYREIAEILEMSLGAVCLSLTRSLARVARSAQR